MMISTSRIQVLATAVAALCGTVMGVAIPPDDGRVLCTPQRETRLIDDGNPYQKYKYVQLTVSFLIKAAVVSLFSR